MPREYVNNAYDVISRMYSGQSYVYHTGFLARDRELHKPVNTLAADLYKYAQAGLIYLTQRKVRDDYYEYIVTRSSRRLKGALA